MTVVQKSIIIKIVIEINFKAVIEMRMTDQLQAFILETVRLYYRHDKDFFLKEEIAISPSSVSKLRKNDRHLNNYNSESVLNILTILYTETELRILNALTEKNFRTANTLEIAYQKIKKDTLLKWIESDFELTLTKEKLTTYNGQPAKEFLLVQVDVKVTVLKMRFKSKRYSTECLTQQDIKSWLRKNINQLQ